MPSWCVRCTHCHQEVRVETVGYDNECPVCQNVLPPIVPEAVKLPRSAPLNTVGTTTDSMKLTCDECGAEVSTVDEFDAHRCSVKPSEPSPVLEPEPVDDGLGVDLGDVRLGNSSE